MSIKPGESQGVQDDTWEEYRWGKRRTRTLLHGWELQADERTDAVDARSTEILRDT